MADVIAGSVFAMLGELDAEPLVRAFVQAGDESLDDRPRDDGDVRKLRDNFGDQVFVDGGHAIIPMQPRHPSPYPLPQGKRIHNRPFANPAQEPIPPHPASPPGGESRAPLGDKRIGISSPPLRGRGSKMRGAPSFPHSGSWVASTPFSLRIGTMNRANSMRPFVVPPAGGRIRSRVTKNRLTAALRTRCCAKGLGRFDNGSWVGKKDIGRPLEIDSYISSPPLRGRGSRRGIPVILSFGYWAFQIVSDFSLRTWPQSYFASSNSTSYPSGSVTKPILLPALNFSRQPSGQMA